MSIDPEHEKAYSPSAWTNRTISPNIVQYFIETGEKFTNKARSMVSCELDIPYGIDDREKYDVYGTNLPDDSPIFVFIFGGYWLELSKESSGFHIENLVSNGIKVYNIGYTLCPAVTVSDIVAQIKRALKKIIEQARDIGSKRVWIAGHSVGAHLAASLLHDSHWLDSMKRNGCLKFVKGFILIAGIYNLEPLLRTSYNEALKLSSMEIESLSFASLDTSGYEKISDMKVITIVGECDAPKFVQESRLYAQKLVEFVDNVEFMVLRDGIDHFNIIENLADKNFVLTNKIMQLIKAH